MNARRLFALAATLAVGAAAHPALAGAQAAAQSAAPAAAQLQTHWDAHPVGKYSLSLTLPDREMAVDLTLSDSAGTVVANFWPVGDHDGHDMQVTVKDTDLLLHADSPGGAIDIVLRREGDRITGTWSRGGEHGPLTGTIPVASTQR